MKMQMEDDEDAAAVFDELVKSVEHEVDVTLNDAVYYFRAECNAALGRLEEAVKGLTTCMETDGSLSEEAVEKAVEGLTGGDVAAERIDAETNEGAVSFDTGSFSGFLGDALVTLEKMFKDAMESRTDGANSVRINLEKDTAYEGDVTLSNVGYNVGNDFEVQLVAEDAGEDYLQSEGTTAVAGNITIKGINCEDDGRHHGRGKNGDR
ncbi:MAG: hypothetical protein IKH57_13665 [Clostridia bacterium]|nr:hypothetical protein [Clostridia bacterium]